MNYEQAKRTAQANANSTGVPWVVFLSTSGAVRVERDWATRKVEAQVFRPEPKPNSL